MYLVNMVVPVTNILQELEHLTEDTGFMMITAAVLCGVKWLNYE